MPDDRPLAGPKPPTPEEEIRAHTIGELKRHDAPVTLVDYDSQWPRLYEREERRIRAALGDRAIRIEHTGSTSVPGLAAKPIIDILLVVPDSADESAYVPQLEAVGYVLRIREPDWHEHRLFKGPETNVNVHTFSPGCPEIERMVGFRDWLRTHDEDRDLYERTKRGLAAREWQYVQHYADAKTEVVEAILARAGLPGAGG
ncbi:MAG TPA: GrpB family protein [Candidatus Limnocylindrales bacterium]|nr:GrpB family protein [Candidatus Limnocylindrales bacterium]